MHCDLRRNGVLPKELLFHGQGNLFVCLLISSSGNTQSSKRNGRFVIRCFIPALRFSSIGFFSFFSRFIHRDAFNQNQPAFNLSFDSLKTDKISQAIQCISLFLLFITANSWSSMALHVLQNMQQCVRVLGYTDLRIEYILLLLCCFSKRRGDVRMH